ncbi:52 kDa repressor of the inhibitor of the protein kinase-like [Aphis gossypii]|uniref:52 kDa repressor of the inhibitor of the protein kinase-like n=1 Tax=Aphis gossypii TaxID=80765 RepID=UPI002158A68C|nr:52 kDa repressor of the inhibitor of the protein kinase-like [Aphis gossypii]
MSEKRKSSSSILSYFKKSNNSINDQNDIDETLLPSTSTVFTPLTDSLEPSSSKNLTHPASNNDTEIIIKTYDIGLYIQQIIDDHTRYNLLKNHWVAPKSYVYPFSLQNLKGKEIRRHLQQKHLDMYPWVVYSESKNGLYCKYCTLFYSGGHGTGKKNYMTLGLLVNKPLQNFKHLMGNTGDLHSHEITNYHIESVLRAQDFIKTYQNPSLEVVSQIDSNHLKQITENRNRLRPIIKSVLFLARQNIPFRGHRDDGPLLKNNELSPKLNEGNFREILKFRIESGDMELENHLKNTSSKATYIIKRSPFYSIMFDETTDMSHTSQLCLVIRYINEEYTVQEDFLGFIDPHSYNFENSEIEPKLNGKILGETVLKLMNNFNLDLNNCVGIATDGCSVMASKVCGAVKTILEKIPSAVKCPCFNHGLNLAISKGCQIQSIRNSFGQIKEIISFFHGSSKRNFVLQSVLHSSLQSLCETRWVERHTAVTQFLTGISEIMDSLHKISNWNDRESSSKAKVLLNSIDFEFVITLYVASHIFSITQPLSVILQKKNFDKQSAVNYINKTIEILNKLRLDVKTEFKNLYFKAVKQMDKLEITVKKPRTISIQHHRQNPEIKNVEDYFRVTVYIPFLDFMITDMKSRFTEETLGVFANKEAFIGKLQGEMIWWEEYWNREKNDIPDTALKSLEHCDKDMFPTIHILLKILASFPISIASAERSFSALKRIKTWLRCNMLEERLTGLAIIHCHRDEHVDIDENDYNNESMNDEVKSV